MSRNTPSLPPHFRRNFTAILTDYIFFSVAFSFADPGIVMPAFVGMLTDSAPIVGLVGTVFAAGWLLPQLGGAAMMSSRPRKKPYLVAAIYAGRPLILLLGLVTWSGLPRYPTAMLTAFFTMLGLFTALDGIASVAWFDILARAVPLTRRGRLIGISQLVSGFLGIGVGLLVEAILGSPVLPFPRNYGLLFILSGLAHVPSVVALSLIKEPEAEGAIGEERFSLRRVLGQLAAVWRSDPDFRRLTSVRWLTGLMQLATSFYVLHASEMFGLPQGRLLASRMAGGIVASLGLGWLSERRGPRPIIWLGSAAALGSPLLALLVHLVNPAAPIQADIAYRLVYFLLGVTFSAQMLGHFNYLLEIASDERRTLYIGLSNTLSGVLVPASFLGGVLLRATSYPVLFAVTAVCVAGGLVASLGLRDLRQEKVV